MFAWSSFPSSLPTCAQQLREALATNVKQGPAHLRARPHGKPSMSLVPPDLTSDHSSFVSLCAQLLYCNIHACTCEHLSLYLSLPPPPLPPSLYFSPPLTVSTTGLAECEQSGTGQTTHHLLCLSTERYQSQSYTHIICIYNHTHTHVLHEISQ